MTPSRWFLLPLAMLCLVTPMARAQSGGTFPQSGIKSYPSAADSTGSGGSNDSPFGVTDHVLMHRMEEARKVERKRRMVDSADRLLALTQQLRADLQGRKTTPEDEKRLDEIARLARQVKDQMRN